MGLNVVSGTVCVCVCVCQRARVPVSPSLSELLGRGLRQQLQVAGSLGMVWVGTVRDGP